MTAHKHAALMLQYAQDAAETETPCERWQVLRCGIWLDLEDHPVWETTFEYRRKPRMININGHEVPEPVREPLKHGENYWGACTSGITRFQWYDDDNDRKWLASGLIHLTREAAQQHVDALLSFTRRETE